MRFPVDVGVMRFRIAIPPREVKDFDTGETKTRDGVPVWEVSLTAMDGTDAELIRVKVPGPVSLAPDELVTVTGLSCMHWSMGERSGMSFAADKLTVSKPSTTAPAASSGGAK